MVAEPERFLSPHRPIRFVVRALRVATLRTVKLLLIEDSHRLQRSLGAGLTNSGFALDQAFDGDEARAFLGTGGYDVVVLDLMIPKVSGLELLAWLRGRGDRTHVIILSAMDRVEDRVRGLDLGADDYLIKPFSFDELVSRIRAVSRRLRDDARGAGTSVSVGDVTVDTVARSVTVAGEPVVLTPHEYALLELLMRRRGQVFSHDRLIERLYAAERDVTRNAVEVHVSALRRKLKAAGVEELVRTRRGFGYLVEA